MEHGGDVLCLIVGELSCNHPRTGYGAVDRRRFDDVPVERDRQDVADMLSREGAKTRDGIALHGKVDLRMPGMLVKTDPNLCRVQVFASEESLATGIIVSIFGRIKG